MIILFLIMKLGVVLISFWVLWIRDTNVPQISKVNVYLLEDRQNK